MIAFTATTLGYIALAAIGYGLAITGAYFALRVRHRACKATLARVRGERTELRNGAWAKATSHNPDTRPALGTPARPSR